jgi:hypothetical protein
MALPMLGKQVGRISPTLPVDTNGFAGHDGGTTTQCQSRC